ncbi:MAG: hypothetical protein JO306_14815 [Gemmatimonadetes bacterium]|nr:hypothetical protein [Gemmatimonadota bacterium]
MSQTGPDRYDWLHFVRRSGPEGTRWAEGYLESKPLEELSTRALHHLRARRFEEGRAPLDELGAALAGGSARDPSVHAVLERWYYGVLGYWFYAQEEFDQADAAMARAHDAVTAALGLRRFLLPLANHCHEFRLHRARIARNRHRWDEMRAHVNDVREMVEGRLPYTVLADGTPVWIADICAFYASLPGAEPAEIAPVSRLLDDASRLADFEAFVRAMYGVPGFVIPYP